jgi:type II secretory pathway pseudopilin PulG
MADRIRSAVFNSLGITLMETIIALAMFSSAGTAVLLGVSAAHVSSDRVKASAVAENLARNQMEYIRYLRRRRQMFR